MLRRHQVLLEDWQVEATKALADGSGASHSETVRDLVNVGLLTLKKLPAKFNVVGKEATERFRRQSGVNEFEARKLAQRIKLIK